MFDIADNRNAQRFERVFVLTDGKHVQHRLGRVSVLTVTTGAVGVDFAYFGTFGQCDHAKGRAAAVTLVDHVEVAHLKDLQGQQTAGVQHSAQRKQRHKKIATKDEMASTHTSQHWQLQLFPEQEAQVFESLQPFIISGIYRQSVIQFNKPNLIISMPIQQVKLEG
jgi:hypothetical protein